MLTGEPREGNARRVPLSLRQTQESLSAIRSSLPQNTFDPTPGLRRQAHKLRRFCVLICFLSVFLTCFASAQQTEAKNVLVLYSHEREMATYALLDKGLRSELESASAPALTVYTEYLDLLRFPDRDQQ
jgi:hypothetical protein